MVPSGGGGSSGCVGSRIVDWTISSIVVKLVRLGHLRFDLRLVWIPGPVLALILWSWTRERERDKKEREHKPLSIDQNKGGWGAKRD